MSFRKYVAFKILSGIGAILACLGTVLIIFLLVLFRQTPLFSIQLLTLSIILLPVGIVTYWYGSFRERAEQIRKGVEKLA
jgi:predicted membrane channel-forming protein YqfA (hemolysin III family)